MLGSFCIWPSRPKIQKNMPDCFKNSISKLLRNYWCLWIKGSSTIKHDFKQWDVFIIQEPHNLQGKCCNFTVRRNYTLSSLLEGSVSEKELVRQSGLLPLLQPGNQLMTDKGFVIQDLLAPLEREVVMLSFLFDKGQFSRVVKKHRKPAKSPATLRFSPAAKWQG